MSRSELLDTDNIYATQCRACSRRTTHRTEANNGEIVLHVLRSFTRREATTLEGALCAKAKAFHLARRAEAHCAGWPGWPN